METHVSCDVPPSTITYFTILHTSHAHTHTHTRTHTHHTHPIGYTAGGVRINPAQGLCTWKAKMRTSYRMKMKVFLEINSTVEQQPTVDIASFPGSSLCAGQQKIASIYVHRMQWCCHSLVNIESPRLTPIA